MIGSHGPEDGGFGAGALHGLAPAIGSHTVGALRALLPSGCRSGSAPSARRRGGRTRAHAHRRTPPGPGGTHIVSDAQHHGSSRQKPCTLLLPHPAAVPHQPPSSPTRSLTASYVAIPRVAEQRVIVEVLPLHSPQCGKASRSTVPRQARPEPASPQFGIACSRFRLLSLGKELELPTAVVAHVEVDLVEHLARAGTAMGREPTM
jgi:hypothetical protein